MLNVFLMFEYNDWVRRNRESLVPAVDRGIEECVRCGYCCIRRTCIPTPQEIPVIAEYLGISVDELVSKYTVGDKRDGKRFLMWINDQQHDIAGTFASSRRTFDMGRCVFLQDDNTCRIWDVKPRVATDASCWIEEDTFDGISAWEDGDMESFGVEEVDEYADDW